MADKGGENRVRNTAGDMWVDPVKSKRPVRISVMKISVASDPIDPNQRKNQQYRALKCSDPVFIMLTMLTLVILLSLRASCTVSEKYAEFECKLVLLVGFGFCINFAVILVLPERFTVIVHLYLDLILVFIYLCLSYLQGNGVVLARLIIAGVNVVMVFAPWIYLNYGYFSLGTVLFKTGRAGQTRGLSRNCLRLLLYELQVSISMILLIMALRPQHDAQDIVLHDLVFTFVWFLLLHWGLKRERMWLTVCTSICTLSALWAPPVYVYFRLFEHTKGDEEHHLYRLASAISLFGGVDQLIRLLIVVLVEFEHKDAAHGVSLAEPYAAPVIQV